MKPGVSGREPAVDAYRGLAVLMMFVVHARRLEAPSNPDGAARTAAALLRWVMWAEPFIAASFLFIVGVSLVLSRERAPEGRFWLRRLLVRAGGLYGLAVALFVPQYGLALPDLVASPGILSVIALALAAVGCALVTPRPATAVALLALGVLAVTGALDAVGWSVPGLNGGPGGAFPLVAFAAVGALVALGTRRAGPRALGVTAAAAVPLCLLVVGLGSPWTTTQLSVHPDYGGEVALTGIFSIPAESVPLAFWNHSVAGCAGLLLPVVAALGALELARPWLSRPPLGQVGLLGRHALAAYVGHLVVLGLLEIAGLTPRNPWQTWGLVALLGVAATGAAAALEARKREPHGRPRAW